MNKMKLDTFDIQGYTQILLWPVRSCTKSRHQLLRARDCSKSAQTQQTHQAPAAPGPESRVWSRPVEAAWRSPQTRRL